MTAPTPADYGDGDEEAGGTGRCQARSVLAHVSIQCADFERSAAFYDAVLAPLGDRRVMEDGDAIGYGLPPAPTFWIGRQRTGDGFRETHIAFAAPDRAAVRAFFDAAVATGAEVLHEPRLWPQYDPSSYGAFVRDPDGNNVEARAVDELGSSAEGHFRARAH
jgi:catechol 2,3-dioxygenase-like lactoylglutathione lyase family enzyme